MKKRCATLELLSTGIVDGLIISLSEETQAKEQFSHVKDFINNQIPLVMFDRVTDEIDCDKVIVDDFEAGYKITKHLLKTGCKNIALVSTIFNSSVGKLRVEGYKKAIEEFEIEFDEQLHVKLNKADNLYVLLTILLDYKKIDAIIGLDEITAVDVLNIIRAKGIEIPNEISIIGFTNGRLSKYVSPSLTMVSQHGKYIGEISADILIDRIEEEDQTPLPFSTKLVKTSLIERESTKVLSVSK